MIELSAALLHLVCRGGLLLACCTGAWAQPLTLLTEINPPLQTRLPNGELGGPGVEVVREIQRRVNNNDPITLVPWARGYRMVETQPNTALFVMARTASRNALFQWVGPFTETNYALYVKTDSPITLRNLADAKQLGSIGVYRDDARDQMLTQAGFANLDRTVENLTNARKLMMGRVDAFASSDSTIDDQMSAAGFARDSVREALSLMKVQTWLAFSRQTPESTVRAWADALESMKKDRTFDALMEAGMPGRKLPGRPITQFPDR